MGVLPLSLIVTGEKVVTINGDVTRYESLGQ